MINTKQKTVTNNNSKINTIEKIIGTIQKMITTIQNIIANTIKKIHYKTENDNYNTENTQYKKADKYNIENKNKYNALQLYNLTFRI